ncbi:sodium channel epithelial 1 subunit delta [Homo sapiens]|uniref:Sodium channel epithelial 1 subunit delta n=1 Tax=Homo sapiens TaxID=9606 RepID=F8VWH5_HUMAN|nr:sodium channel epithelial 1 subunit delta [Homo sapiens]
MRAVLSQKTTPLPRYLWPGHLSGPRRLTWSWCSDHRTPTCRELGSPHPTPCTGPARGWPRRGGGPCGFTSAGHVLCGYPLCLLSGPIQGCGTGLGDSSMAFLSRTSPVAAASFQSRQEARGSILLQSCQLPPQWLSTEAWTGEWKQPHGGALTSRLQPRRPPGRGHHQHHHHHPRRGTRRGWWSCPPRSGSCSPSSAPMPPSTAPSAWSAPAGTASRRRPGGCCPWEPWSRSAGSWGSSLSVTGTARSSWPSLCTRSASCSRWSPCVTGTHVGRVRSSAIWSCWTSLPGRTLTPCTTSTSAKAEPPSPPLSPATSPPSTWTGRSVCRG